MTNQFCITEIINTHDYVHIKTKNLIDGMGFSITAFLNHSNYEFTIFHKYKKLNKKHSDILYLLNNKYIKLQHKSIIANYNNSYLNFPENPNFKSQTYKIYSSTFKITPLLLIKLI